MRLGPSCKCIRTKVHQTTDKVGNVWSPSNDMMMLEKNALRKLMDGSRWHLVAGNQSKGNQHTEEERIRGWLFDEQGSRNETGKLESTAAKERYMSKMLQKQRQRNSDGNQTAWDRTWMRHFKRQAFEDSGEY